MSRKRGQLVQALRTLGVDIDRPNAPVIPLIGAIEAYALLIGDNQLKVAAEELGSELVGRLVPGRGDDPRPHG